MAKNLRDIVKKNPTPARPRFGVDPSDPWSAKANIYEDGMLNKFLSSRGINPKFVSKDTKISHAKSSAFLKWRQDHVVEETQLDEDMWLNRFLSSRGLDPKFVTTDKKVSFAKSGEFSKWLRDHKPDLGLRKENMEQVDEVSGMGINRSRSHEPSQADHDTVKRHLKNLMAIHTDEPTATTAVHRAIKKVSTAGVTSTKTRSREVLKALIQKHSIPIDAEHRALLNREQVEQKQLDELAPETLASYVLKTTSKDPKRAEPRKKAMSKLAKVMAKRSFTEEKKPKLTSLDKFRKAASEREKKHDDVEKEMKARHAAGKEDMKGSIDRLEKQLNKEAIDTKDLISKLQKDLPKVNDSENKDTKPVNWTGPKKDDYGYTGYQGHGMPTDKQERQDSKKIKEETGVSKSAETKFHKKLDKLVHSTFGKRKDEMKMKEEVDITEKNDSHTHAAHYEDPKTGEWTGMNLLVAKDDDDAIRQAHEKCKEGCRLTKVERHITVKEEVEQIDEVSKSEVEHHFNNWTNSEHAPYNSDAGDDNKVHQSALRYLRSTNVPKENHEKLAMHIADKFHGSGINEGSEQIDELKKSTVFSWLKQQPVVPEKKPDMSRKDHNKKIKSHNKSWNRALDRLSGYKPTSEDVYHDPQAATQMPFDGANNTNDTSPMKREMSKSARMIKSLYKSKNMKEDMYDWEKDDKSTKGYGKKPKMTLTDKKDSIGENKPEAVAIMTGGKTLTGQNRDDVEIDPSMKKRPGQSGTDAQDGSKTR